MSNILIDADALVEWPLLDKELHYINPARIFTPDNCHRLSLIDAASLNRFRFGHIVREQCSYSRFDLSDSPYCLLPNNKYNILPDSTPALVDFNDITDARVIELEKDAIKYEKVFLFWSGGIDSTLILSAILKTGSAAFHKKLTIVLNRDSIKEFPEMYDKFIHGKLSEMNADDFVSGKIFPTNEVLYLTGGCGDSIFGYSEFAYFDQQCPGIYNTPWKKHKDELISYFSQTTNDTLLGAFAMEYIIDSLLKAKIEVESVFDFLWWIDFNWGYDPDLYMNWWFGEMPLEIDAKKFIEENLFLFFNCKAYQNWAVASIATDLKVGKIASTNKRAAKQYIFDFTKETNYYNFKLKEMFAPSNLRIYDHRRLIAVDINYNFYYGTPFPLAWL